MDTTMICGEAALLINVQEIISMVVLDFLMETTTSILLWVEKLLLLIHSSSTMDVFKLELNYQKVIGYGLQYGYYQEIMNMENGQQVDKLISWKAEVMLVILENLEEDLIHLVQLYIGDLIMHIISIIKPMLKNLWMAVLLLMISMYLDFIGTIKHFIPIWTMILIKFCKSIIQIWLIGKDLVFKVERILGKLQHINALPLINNFIWLLTWPLVVLLDISKTELLVNLGLICPKELHLNSMITRDNGGQLGVIIQLSKLIMWEYGTLLWNKMNKLYKNDPFIWRNK